MWSYDSPNHRDLRVRSVVERMMREGMGSEKEDLRSDLSDVAVQVISGEDLKLIEPLVPDLKASVEDASLTMAASPDEPTGVFAVQGCMEDVGLTVDVDVCSDGHGSVTLGSDLPELPLTVTAIAGSSRVWVLDGKESQVIAASQDDALSPNFLSVSCLHPSRCADALDFDSEVRGDGTVMTSGDFVAGGGLKLDDGVSGDTAGELGSLGDAVSGGNSDELVNLPGSVCLGFPADSIADSSLVLSDCGNILDVNGLVSEEGLVPSVAREAVRPPPTDGRRQPPLPPADSALVAGRGVSMPSTGGGLPIAGGGVVSADRGGGDGGGVHGSGGCHYRNQLGPKIIKVKLVPFPRHKQLQSQDVCTALRHDPPPRQAFCHPPSMSHLGNPRSPPDLHLTHVSRVAISSADHTHSWIASRPPQSPRLDVVQ
ncbi:hypothetical protein Dimus_036286 [Dionaea muscipula]